MSPVAVKPEYYDARIEQLLDAFSSKVLQQLPSRVSSSTLGARMLRSQEVFDLLTEYSTNAQKDAFRGVCLVDYSAPQSLFTRFKATMTKCFSEKVRQYRQQEKELAGGDCEAAGGGSGKGGSAATRVLLLWRELQRISAECCSLMQYAELHDQQNKTPTKIKEVVYGLYAEAWEGELTEIAERTLCDELVRHREQQVEQALINAKASFMLRMAIAPPSQRTDVFDKIEQRYLSALRSYLGKTVHVPSDIRDYIVQINTIINEEMARVEYVLANHDTQAKAKLNIQLELVADRAMTIINDTAHGVVSCITYPQLQIGEFRQLYNAFEFDKPTLVKMQSALGEAVGKAISGSVAASKGTFHVGQTIQIKSAYSNLVKAAVPGEQAMDFHLAVQHGIVNVIPNSGAFEEALVSKIDTMIRNNGKEKGGGGSGGSLRPGLAHTLNALNLIPSPELFSAHYKKALATRLLLKQDPDLKAERMVILELTKLRGSAYTKHFTIMVEEAGNQPVLCHAAVWPSGFSNRVSSSSPGSYSPAISTAFKEFVQEQEKRHPNCDVWVDNDHSIVELNMECPGVEFTCRVLATTAQAQVLLAFDTAAASVKDGEGERVSLSEEALIPLVAPISKAALSIALLTLKEANFLVKEAGGTPSGGSLYTVNMEYMKGATGHKKVALPTVGPKRQVG